MADQYVEAAGEERFDAAVALTLELWSESQSLPIEQVAAGAVHEVFCGCVAQIYTEEEMARHLLVPRRRHHRRGCTARPVQVEQPWVGEAGAPGAGAARNPRYIPTYAGSSGRSAGSS
jgi:hypothetical protein